MTIAKKNKIRETALELFVNNREWFKSLNNKIECSLCNIEFQISYHTKKILMKHESTSTHVNNVNLKKDQQ